jgi:hypothetical protein
MSTKKLHIDINVPIMQGTVSTSMLPCGKPNCVCKAKRPKLHGPYYRWTGLINGKRTSRTITKTAAKECERRIENYRKIQKKLDELLKKGLENAPWIEKENL